MNPINTIDDVLTELDKILAISVAENDALVYFAFLYKRTTQEILKGIEAGRFEDKERIIRFDIVFAKMYIQAWHDFREGKPVSKSAAIAFENKDAGLIVLQHLILGMNVHINLDLGNAAAMIAPGAEITSLEKDFMTVNQILTDLIDEMQKRLGRVSFFMFLLDWVGGRKGDQFIGWSISKARDAAWKFAQNLAASEGEEREKIYLNKDKLIAKLGAEVASPPGRITRIAIRIIRMAEVKNVEKVLELLAWDEPVK